MGLNVAQMSEIGIILDKRSGEIIFNEGDPGQDISKQVSESLMFIGKVAQQTKIFGLNASIEAARSGEFGRGFGVIAEEIRKLSEVSRQNADKMSALTLQINVKMEQVTQAATTSTQKSQEQSLATHNMVNSVEEVAGMAHKLAEIANSL